MSSPLTDDRGPWEDVPGGLGLVLDDDRGSLPYALIHGEALVACAAWALGQAGVTPVDDSVDWATLAALGEPVVLHDSLCPMTPPEFIAALVTRCLEDDVALVGVRPVTDTVKVLTDTLVGATVDRDDLLMVTSPLVLPARVAAAGERPANDLATAVADLVAAGHHVEVVTAPAQGRRVSSPEAVEVLAALSRA